MNLDFIKIKQQVVSCYMLEGGKLFEGPGFKGFKDIVEEISFKDRTEFKMVFPANVGDSIETYDANHTNKRLSNNVIQQKKIDVTAGDLCVSPTQIILNFTDFPIVCYNQFNTPTTLPRLENKTLNDKFRGNVVLLTVHRLNNPKRVSDVTGNSKNYLQDLLDKYRTRVRTPLSRFANYMDIIEFAQESWDKLNYFDAEYNCNMITVVTSAIIPSESFRVNNKPGASEVEYQSLMLAEHDLLLTKDSVFFHKENPSLEKYFDVNEFKNKVMTGSRFIYLVDRNNKLQDRWYYSHGTVELIPKITSGDLSLREDGLYFGRYDDEVGIRISAPIPLEEIDKLDFIYTSKEHAERGADKAEQWRQELSERESRIKVRELELRDAGNEKKAQYESTIQTLKMENERIKNDFQRQAHERELEFTEFKRNLERDSMRDRSNYDRQGYHMKNYFDERKYEREDVSYGRESYIETLKTVAATAGVIATGFMIYKQLSKAS